MTQPDPATIAGAHTDAVDAIKATLAGDHDAVAGILARTTDHLEFVGSLLAMAASIVRLLPDVDAQLEAWSFAAAVETYSETGQ
jgi:hypothetical protein